MRLAKKFLMMLLSVTLVVLSAFAITACNGKESVGKESVGPDSGKTPKADAFTAKTVFYLDCADVPTFGAFLEESTFTFETDGTFTSNFDFTAAGAVAGPTVFNGVTGTYSLSADKTKITFTEPWKAMANQSLTEEKFDPEKITTAECALTTLENGSYKMVRIYNGTLAMPYYSDKTQFDSLKEFEYPAALGEKVIFDSQVNLVAYTKGVPESESLGKLAGLEIALRDDGSYYQELKLTNADGQSYKLTEEGGYKLDSKTAPTKLKLLKEGAETPVEHNITDAGGYYIVTYVSENFGNVTLYSDVDKMPVDGAADGWPSNILGNKLRAFEKTVTFEAKAPQMEGNFAGMSGTPITLTFNRDGSVEMKLPELNLKFPLFYNLSEDGTKVTIVDGENQQVCEIRGEAGSREFDFYQSTINKDIRCTEKDATVTP